MMAKRFALIFTFCFFYNNSYADSYQQYGYQHLVGVTGINTVLHDSKGKLIKIKFSKYSDKIALEALKQLNWNVIYPNANGKDIIFYGKLEPNKQKTKAGPTFPEPEVYQYFILKHWYIKKPIKFQTFDESDITSYYITTYVQSLSEAGYHYIDINGVRTSYSKFEKPLQQ